MEIIIPLSDKERAAIQEKNTEKHLEAAKLNSLGIAGIDLSAIKCPIQRQNTVDYLIVARRNHTSRISNRKSISGTASEKK